MAHPPARFDAWPLLPRSTKGQRPADEPAHAALTAAVGLAALFLLLRWVPGGGALAAEVAQLVAFWGCLGGLALLLVLMALLVGAAIAMPMMPMPGGVKNAALAVFDHAVHLALVLSTTGVLAVVVLHGSIPGLAIWFAAQALVLWGCHRMRLWLARPFAA